MLSALHLYVYCTVYFISLPFLQLKFLFQISIYFYSIDFNFYLTFYIFYKINNHLGTFWVLILCLFQWLLLGPCFHILPYLKLLLWLSWISNLISCLSGKPYSSDFVLVKGLFMSILLLVLLLLVSLANCISESYSISEVHVILASNPYVFICKLGLVFLKLIHSTNDTNDESTFIYNVNIFL